MANSTDAVSTAVCTASSSNTLPFIFSMNGGSIQISGSNIVTKLSNVTAIVGVGHKNILACSTEGSLLILNTSSKKTEASAFVPSRLPVTCIALIEGLYGSEKTLAAVGDVGGSVSLWNTETLEMVDRFQVGNGKLRAVTGIASWSPPTSSIPYLLVATASSARLHCIHNSKIEFSISCPRLISFVLSSPDASTVFVVSHWNLYILSGSGSSAALDLLISLESDIVAISYYPSSPKGTHRVLVSCQDCTIHVISIISNSNSGNNVNIIGSVETGTVWASAISVGQDPKQPNALFLASVLYNGSRIFYQLIETNGTIQFVGTDEQGVPVNHLKRSIEDVAEKRRMAVFEAIVKTAVGDADKFLWNEVAWKARVVGDNDGAKRAKMDDEPAPIALPASLSTLSAGSAKSGPLEDSEEDGEIVE